MWAAKWRCCPNVAGARTLAHLIVDGFVDQANNLSPTSTEPGWGSNMAA
jgi:hypothetical protein